MTKRTWLKLDNKGSLTVDYLFAFVLVAGFSLAIVTLSTTLTVVEVVQYTAYAAARKFYAGNTDPTAQQSAGARKFNALLNNPVVQPLLNNGWFQINKQGVAIGSNIPGNFPQYAMFADSSGHNLFHGVVVPFTATLLNFEVPFFGPTTLTNAGNNGGFTVNIDSFLGREPNFSECKTFWDQRWQFIQALPNNQGAAGYAPPGASAQYTEVIDNGC